MLVFLKHGQQSCSNVFPGAQHRKYDNPRSKRSINKPSSMNHVSFPDRHNRDETELHLETANDPVQPMRRAGPWVALLSALCYWQYSAYSYNKQWLLGMLLEFLSTQGHSPPSLGS